MKSILGMAVAAAIALACSAAVAQPENDQKPAQVIKVQKAFELFNALKSLNGYQEVVGAGDAKQVVTVPYKFDASVVWAISDDMIVLQRFITNAQATIRSLIDQAEADAKAKGAADAGGKIKNGSPEQAALNDQLAKFLDSEKPIDKLTKIRRDALRAGAVNNIPPGTIADLDFVIEK